MSEPIDDPSYWAGRLREAELAGEPHRAVFRCPLDRWMRIASKHSQILSRLIKPSDSVLDAGCGWGRLLKLMPVEWTGMYVGVDSSPDFIQKAWASMQTQARFYFIKSDLRNLKWLADSSMDWAVMVSVRPMVIRNIGADEWAKMEAEIRRCCRKLLYLEYDENDEGSVE